MTWLGLSGDDPFGPANLPYGVFSTAGTTPRVGVRIGSWVADVTQVARGIPDTARNDDLTAILAAWHSNTLNAFLDLGPTAWSAARSWLQEVFARPEYEAATRPHLLALADVTLHLPFAVADFVDFDTSLEYARNMSRMFRPGTEAPSELWEHLPMGQHSRAGTVVVSGTDIVRPYGQLTPSDGPQPAFGPTRRLDVEVELGYVIGAPTTQGTRVSAGDADDHIFGVVLLNDWAARDILYWEYVPLGPFIGSSFATSISPWVVTTAALNAARVPLAAQHPDLLPYLRTRHPDGQPRAPYGYDITVDFEINGTLVSQPEAAHNAWSPAQLVAHLTVAGAALRSGDLLGSGAISGTMADTRGTLLDLTWGGQEPVTLADGSIRSYLEDGDVVTLRATAPGESGTIIGFGECVGRVSPAR